MRISLGISPTVYGRRSNAQRVQYLVAPDGSGNEYAIPEGVVLKRWRRRTKPGFTFSGSRLSPTLWRALPSALGSDVASWLQLDVSKLEAKIAAWHQLNAQTVDNNEEEIDTAQYEKLPSATIVHALLHYCKEKHLRTMVERHALQVREGKSGVPDLFLFARDDARAVRMVRFVEVKKPREPVLPDQTDEIALMEEMGLNVRLYYLRERK